VNDEPVINEKLQNGGHREIKEKSWGGGAEWEFLKLKKDTNT